MIHQRWTKSLSMNAVQTVEICVVRKTQRKREERSVFISLYVYNLGERNVRFSTTYTNLGGLACSLGRTLTKMTPNVASRDLCDYQAAQQCKIIEGGAAGINDRKL
jgi:hypothetical protein